MNPILPSELLSRRKFCINGNQVGYNYQSIYDAFSDFQDSYNIINTRISSLELNQIPITVKNPMNVTVNKNGQVINIEEAGPQGPFTIIPVTTNTDFTILNPYTLVSIPQAPINARSLALVASNARSVAPPTTNNWTGRWITQEIFNGTVKFSFHINNPKAYVGIVSGKKSIKADIFKTKFKAGFFFKSATVFGVVDVNIKQEESNSNICRIERSWSSTDTFTILYSAKLVRYFQNDENIYTVNKRKKTHTDDICFEDTLQEDDLCIEDTLQKKRGVYVAGAFYTTQPTPITVSQITIDEILPSMQPLMEYMENNTPQILTSEPLVIASVLIQTDVGGKLSASANIVSSGITSLTLRIRGVSIIEDESTSITIDKYGNIIYGTEEVYPAGTYIVELLASGTATVMYAHLQAMAQLI